MKRSLPSDRLPTFDEAVTAAARTLVATRRAAEQMTPREQAEAAYTPTGPSVDVLEDRIRARRGLPALDRGERS